MFYMYEYFQKLENLPTKKEKLEYLRSNRHPSVDILFKFIFDKKNHKLDLPNTIPPYKKSIDDDRSAIHYELKLIQRNLINDPIPLSKSKKEQIFIDSLEYVDSNDALLIESILTGTLPFKTITDKLVKEALPEIFA